MSHPRVEEVSDSDLSDPSEGNISDFDEADIIRVNPTANRPSAFSSSTAASSSAAAAAASQSQFRPPPRAGPATQFTSSSDAKQYADFQCLYPIYFSSLHSRQEGRRVSAELAVPNPLARDIAQACSQLGLQVLFEPGKSHPKDWPNPGRVRVKLRAPTRPGAPEIKNKHHLYRLVADYLKRHPTTENSASLRLSGVPGIQLPKEGEKWPRPAVPKGWKMPELLPFISPAMTGGGVSENLFKDMMKEMQSGGDPMAALMGGMGGGGGGDEPAKKKKDKKGKNKA